MPSERNRQPVAAEADEPLGAARDRRDRGPALLRARRRRPRGHRAGALGGRARRQGRPGRLDDHAAARAQPLPRHARADGRAQGQGGLPGAQARQGEVEAVGALHVPEHRAVRQPRARHRGRGADLLLQARSRPDAARGGAAGGPAAGAVLLRAVRQPRQGPCAPEPGAAIDAADGRHRPEAVRLGGAAGARARAGQALPDDPRAVLLQLRAGRARPRVRRRDRALRRPEGLHDDHPPLSAGGNPRHPGGAALSRRSGRVADLDRPAHGRDPRDDGVHARHEAEPVQPALPGAPPAGLDLQDLRAGRRRRGWGEPDTTYYSRRPSTTSRPTTATARPGRATGGASRPTRATTTATARSPARRCAPTTPSSRSSRWT